MNTAGLHTLTGAYAVDAVTGEEREAFESHLADCPSCAQEVRELTATAEVLGRAASRTPPPELKERVLRQIATVRQEPPQVPDQDREQDRDRGGGAAPPRGRRTPPRLLRLALAACLAAAAALGGAAVWQYQAAEDARREARQEARRAEAVAEVLAAPDAALAAGDLPGGARGTVVVSRAEDRAVFLATGMDPAPGGRVYQLWFERGGEMRPAGLMSGGTANEAVLLEGRVADATGMGITLEPAGGSPEPTSDPLAVMELPA